MAIFNMGGGGGSTIPFEVIVSERKPTTIRKDTIWVNPDLTKISPYEKINLNIPIKGPLTAQKDATTTKYCTIFEEEPIIYLDSVKRYFYKYGLTAKKYNCFAISNNVSKFRWGFTSAATAETTLVLDSGIVNITTEYEHSI